VDENCNRDEKHFGQGIHFTEPYYAGKAVVVTPSAPVIEEKKSTITTTTDK
jgi:hypothetical protein